MNSATLYKRANHLQRRDAQDILNEFSQIIQWRENNDSLIDIGCGSGDVTIDFLEPLMPKNFDLIIGVDVSKDMIRYAKKRYRNKSKVSFEVLDITTDQLNKKFHNRFNHVTSFYCLHWVQNQTKAIQNISNILNENGDCLLVFLAFHLLYEIFKCLSKNPKYAIYMQDVDKFIPPLQYSKNPAKVYRKLMKSVGLSDCYVDVRQLQYVYDGSNCLKRSVEAVSPFTKRMSIDLREEFLDEFVDCAIKMNIGQKINEDDPGSDYRFISPYKLVVAYARKK